MLLIQLPLLLQLAAAPAPVHFLPGMAYGPSGAPADIDWKSSPPIASRFSAAA